MSRRRYITTDISTDARINRLALTAGDFAVLLYTWMIPHASDEAILPLNIEELMLIVIPGRRDKTPEQVEEAIESIAALELICIDRAANKIRFPSSFYKYQTYIGSDRRSAESAQNSAKQRKTAQNAVSVKPLLSVKDSDSVSSTATRVPAREEPPAENLAPARLDEPEGCRAAPLLSDQNLAFLAERHIPADQIALLRGGGTEWSSIRSAIEEALSRPQKPNVTRWDKFLLPIIRDQQSRNGSAQHDPAPVKTTPKKPVYVAPPIGNPEEARAENERRFAQLNGFEKPRGSPKDLIDPKVREMIKGVGQSVSSVPNALSDEERDARRRAVEEAVAVQKARESE